MIRPVIVSICVVIAGALASTINPSSAAAQGGCFAQFESDYGNFARSNPQNSSWGARDTFQYAYFMGEQGLNILMKYQSCMDAADFATNFQALDGMREKGREGCRALDSSGGGACTPTYPGR